MVYQDISSATPKHAYRIAPLTDRLLAAVFDVVLFAPVFSFILASLFRKLELTFFVAPNSVEFLVLCGVSVVFVGLLTILFQTLFLQLMGATPGKYFFKLQVVPIHAPSEKLRFSQSLLRSFLWVMEVFCFLLPFLEVISEPLRRPLHDRASGTMLITLKKQGDPGPQAFETQVVRQLLVLTSLCAILWVIVLTGHFYKQAVRGDYKKSELEAANYLCESVSQTVEKNELRIDKALALYLADEITENCLASEADFVLWSQQEEEKSWAYLAKGFLNEADTETLEAYLEKSCEVDEEGVPCQIAQYKADPSEYRLPSESETATVLKVTEEFEKGLYAKAEKEFLKLSQKTGYETFVQQGLVKAFWAQNKTEKARGAYQNVVYHLGASRQIELSAWVCHEEMDQSCSHEAIEACENLKNSISEAKSPIKETFVALALLREKDCRQSTAVDFVQFHELFKEKKDVLAFVKAFSKDSNLQESERIQILADLALRKEPVRPLFLRRMALQKWAELTRDEGDLNRIAQFLKDKKVRDLSWIKVYQRTLESTLKTGSRKILKEIVDLPSVEMVRTYQLQTLQVQAHYFAQNYEKAWKELKSLQPTGNRVPASVGKLDLKTISQALEEKMKLKEERQ